jgi:site-specific DNA-methyltransferase (adenine-specific)
MKIVEMPIGEIHPYENNPRFNDQAVDAVAKSIKEFGFKVPIVIDKNNVIVTGHTRYKASIKLGLKKVPCIKADDLSDKQVKAFRLADNKVSELAEWDFELLNEELKVLGDFDMGEYGFEIIEEEPEAFNDDFDVDEAVPDVPKSTHGDIYRLGRHYLMCGDSTTGDVEKLVKNEAMDMVLTDPPYNVDYSEDRKIENDNMARDQFIEFLTKAFKNIYDSLRPGGAFYVWYASRTGVEFETALNNAGLEVRQQLIWNKNSLVLGRQDYQWKHEPCLYGWKEGTHTFVNERDLTTVIDDEDFTKMDKKHLVKLLESIYSLKSTIIDCERPTKSALHPTMKPVKLMGYLIKNSSKQGDKVLDLFGGSGSTLIACEQLNRSCYMMEYDPKYVDVIIERWEAFTNQKAEKL